MSCVNKPVIYKDCRLLDLPKNAIGLLSFPIMLNKRKPVEVPGFSMEQGPFRSGVRWMRPVPLDIAMVAPALYGLWLLLLVGGGGKLRVPNVDYTS